MNVIFHNPLLAWLVPLVAVPVLVHFLARAKPPSYLFSATFLVKKVARQTVRIKRPKDRLLLIVRTLLFLTLALLFVRPVVFFQHPLPHGDLPRKLVIVIDRSASMNWSEGGRSRFSAACDEAAVLLGGLSSHDLANIVWLDREPDTVFPEPGSNTAFLRERLRDVRCSHEFGNAEQAVKLAIEQLQDGPYQREICIISDFQATQWKQVTAGIPDDIVATTLKPVRDTAENGAVLSIRTVPLSPLAGETAQVIVTAGNYSGTPRNRTIMVKMDEKRVTKQVQIPAWGQASVAMEHVFTAPGQITVNAQLEEDAFGADDWRALPVSVRHALRVGLLEGDTLTGPVFHRAFKALPWVEAVRPGQNSETDVLVLAGWNGTFPQGLEDHENRGLPCLISPAPGLALSSLYPIMGITPPPHPDQTVRLETPDKAVGLTIAHPDHPSLALFKNGEFGDPSHGSFTRRFLIPGWEDEGNVLLRFSDGTPALIEGKEPPGVLVWLAPLDPESGNWAAQPPFLPFLGELLGSLASGKHYPVPDTSLPGETLSFRTGPTVEDVRLTDDADRTYPVVRVDSVSEGTRFVSEPINEPGVYRVCSRETCSPVRIVNFPESESDLRTGPPPVFADVSMPQAMMAEDLQRAREGTPTWPLMAWCALVWIGLESLLVWLIHRDERIMAKGAP